MGNSAHENKSWAASVIYKLKPKTVLDIGPGEGIYGKIVRKYSPSTEKLVGVEIWGPYIESFRLREFYDEVWVCDARLYSDFKYDLVILGDVLEHMSKEDAIALWNKISKQAKYALISIPITHFHQDAANGNPYETHVKEDWTTKEVLDSFHSIILKHEFSITGTYLAKFDKPKKKK
jgi:2-polyprenyl-3-methyl-5-hydroxy-6-metoxy-1,4-benzoquinol methylase